MSGTLKTKIKAIDAEVMRLHYKWKHFKQVFGSDEKVKLLNEAAPVFFGYLWNIMLFDILLSRGITVDHFIAEVLRIDFTVDIHIGFSV